MNNDLISRNDLEKFKILPFDKASCDDTEINAAYQNGWNDAIDRIIDNAPTVENEESIYGDGYQDGHKDGYDKGYDDAQAKFERPHEDIQKSCKTCDYYVNKYGYGQCYGQKDAPRVDDNEVCESWKKGGAE